jgi:hypothetical protein
MCDQNHLLDNLTRHFSTCPRPDDFLRKDHQNHDCEMLRRYFLRFRYNELDVGGLKNYDADIGSLSPEGYHYVFQDLLKYAFKHACKKKQTDYYAELFIMLMDNDLENRDSVIRNKFSPVQLHAAALVIKAIVDCEKEIKRPGIDTFEPSFLSFWSRYCEFR